MNITIEALTPSRSTVLIDYLNKMDFHHAPEWAGCFCRFHHLDCTEEQWSHRSPLQNKNEALLAINEGRMKGFIAFHQDQCVGWVNVNKIESYPKLKSFVDLPIILTQTVCIVCFVIHPEFRHQGLARRLLKAAIEDYDKQAVQAIIGLPFENAVSPEKAYRGSPKMFLEQGFEVVKEKEGVFIMRKVLHP